MASITTFFGTQGGGGSVSGAPGQVCFFDSNSSAVGSDLLYWDAFSDRLSVGDPTTVPSTVTIAGAGASDATSALEVRTDGSYGDLLLFRVYNNGRIDSRMLSSTEALTDNLAIGLGSASSITTGDNNTILGAGACSSLTSGNQNTAAGQGALSNIVSRSGNVAVGANAGRYAGAGPSDPNERSVNSIYIGANSRAFDVGVTVTNETVIGHSAIGNGDNTVTIGNSSVTDVYVNGNIVIQDKNIVLSDSTGTKIGTTTTQKLAFYGDTPIVQPDNLIASATAVHGSGQAVKDDSTFGGYTIGQIVTALQTLGLLA